MTENPNDHQQDPSEKGTCAAEILSLPQTDGEPCNYCADEHPELEEKALAQKAKEKRRSRKRKAPIQTPPRKKGNWFSELSVPWKIVTMVCALLASLGLGKCCADLPKPPSGADCSHTTPAPLQDGALIVGQADEAGNFHGRTRYAYQNINGVRQLVSVKRFSQNGKLTASLTITRDSAGTSCLVQMATFDAQGKAAQMYSDTHLPDSVLLEKEFDFWTYFGQLN